MLEKESYLDKLKQTCRDVCNELAEGAAFYLMVTFVIIFQFFIDFGGDFVSQFHVMFEVLIRSSCFVIVCAIFICMDFDQGLARLHLKIVAIVWLMSIIHCGGVSVYPVHTLVVLSITVSPILNNFMKRFADVDATTVETYNVQQKN